MGNDKMRNCRNTAKARKVRHSCLAIHMPSRSSTMSLTSTISTIVLGNLRLSPQPIMFGAHLQGETARAHTWTTPWLDTGPLARTSKRNFKHMLRLDTTPPHPLPTEFIIGRLLQQLWVVVFQMKQHHSAQETKAWSMPQHHCHIECHGQEEFLTHSRKTSAQPQLSLLTTRKYFLPGSPCTRSNIMVPSYNFTILSDMTCIIRSNVYPISCQ